MTDVVLGAGIVGVSVALHLRMRGRDVVLVDRQAPGLATSYGNAGLLERSDLMPRTFPRDPLEVGRYALGLDEKARVNYAFLPRIAPFLFQYWRNSAPRRAAHLPHELAPLFMASVDAHKELMTAANALDLFREDGWLHLFRTQNISDDMRIAVQRAQDYGMRADIIDGDEAAAREPAMQVKVRAAVHWRDSASVTNPLALTQALAAHFQALGGTVMEKSVTGLTENGAGWRVNLGGDQVDAANVVVALGPWSEDLVKPLGYSFPLAVKRGYHVHYTPDEVAPKLPVIDAENGIALNPMQQGIRMTTGIEFAARDAAPTPAQVDMAEPHARELFKMGARVEAEPWMGCRPCTADMKPIIGPAPHHKGLWFDFGHAHHGLTIGPVSGRALAEFMTEGASAISLDPYLPSRFGR